MPGTRRFEPLWVRMTVAAPSSQEGGGMDLFSLEGRRALVTGGSKGIGFGIARAMALAGADLILTARNSAELEQAAAGLRHTGRMVGIAPCDLRDTEKLPSWYEATVQQHGRPDILVNSAGITPRSPAHETSLIVWNEAIALNLTAVFVISQAFARHCIAAGCRGRIINIASLMTVGARRTTSAYAATKGGIGQLTKGLAVDWADYGILVNAIAPGFIATTLTEPLQNKPDFDAWVKQRCPLGRWGTPEDIGGPAVFLASSAADFVTGQIIFVDGGWIATF